MKTGGAASVTSPKYLTKSMKAENVQVRKKKSVSNISNGSQATLKARNRTISNPAIKTLKFVHLDDPMNTASFDN